MTFGRPKPERPPRTVWADKTKTILDDVRKRRKEINDKLDEEERKAKEVCNHTYPDGRSAIEHHWGGGVVEDEYEYTTCQGCGQ